jgi:hypothetical protein
VHEGQRVRTSFRWSFRSSFSRFQCGVGHPIRADAFTWSSSDNIECRAGVRGITCVHRAANYNSVRGVGTVHHGGGRGGRSPPTSRSLLTLPTAPLSCRHTHIVTPNLPPPIATLALRTWASLHQRTSTRSGRVAAFR